MDKSVNQPTTDILRLDKWLWACRFYKTRALAKDMIEGGKVHYNGQRCKASKTVEVGATVKLTQGTDERTVLVLGLSDKRLSAPLAQALYQETEESVRLRQERAELRKMNVLFAPHPETKPDKKMRRQLLLIKAQQS
ncbi:ribosome-associated heat shock protein Hsp15 [Rheinheimera mesophila]|mgnify:FL=1|uniref:Heat shock protein 15 n=1 Tax=Rheinheimera mesophila TaxID=1547515 RepID=A0A3P3QEW4_9GAMM|nr:ribosome-associated heat shock protein Hsp15 [Rheinheimera mesophila]KKL01745.1 ribosome-associated heat shock protein Hsp15 [Rheinheimera mesophila]RRJ18843.1 ribosome-associated heat shock protein Hsp15 [Rheinheimera mesophila]